MPAEARTSVTPLFKAPVPEPVVEQAPQPVVERVRMPEPVVEQMIAPVVEVPPAMAESIAPIAETTAEITATIAEVSLAEAPEDVTIAETATLEDDAHDLAVLDMVAMEMAVEDFNEPEMDAPEISQLQIAEPVEMDTAATPDVSPMPEVIAVAPEPAQPSLGAALIANGVISNPNAPTGDPLAPIRRMSQAEKIAFFS